MKVLQHIGHERRMRALAREALDWRSFGDESEEANAAFAAWLLKSPEHVQVWLEITAFDEEVAQSLHFPPYSSSFRAVPNSTTPLMEQPDPTDPPTAMEPHAPVREPPPAARAAPQGLWDRLRTPSGGSGTRGRSRTPRGRLRAPSGWLRTTSRGSRTFLAASAIAVLALAGAFAFHALSGQPTRYASAIGEHRTLDLDDGSTVRLNTNSHVDILFSSRARSVRLLDGEALFDVAHDAARPFDVTSSCGTVRAVGTSFLVRVRERNTCELVVAKGMVSVRRARAPQSTVPHVMVSAGETADIGIDGVTVRGISTENISNRLAWLQGQIWFRDEPLSAAVAQFNRYNSVVLVVDDPTIASTRLGGTFRATDLQGFVHALDQVFGVQAVTIERESGTTEIHLRSSNPPQANDSRKILRPH